MVKAITQNLKKQCLRLQWRELQLAKCQVHNIAEKPFERRIFHHRPQQETTISPIKTAPRQKIAVQPKVIKQNYWIYKDRFVVVVTPPLPRGGGTARTVIQIHTVNLIEIRLGERWQTISNQS